VKSCANSSVAIALETVICCCLAKENSWDRPWLRVDPPKDHATESMCHLCVLRQRQGLWIFSTILGCLATKRNPSKCDLAACHCCNIFPRQVEPMEPKPCWRTCANFSPVKLHREFPTAGHLNLPLF
jgi:hypothetical protein